MSGMISLQKDEILVREIIDIDTNYMEDESTGPSAKQKNAGETDKDENSGDGDDDDFNPTLAAMETEIKPKVLKNSKYTNKRIYKINKIPKRKTRLCFKFYKTFLLQKKKDTKRL